jgi:hypothetical protein
MTQDFRADLESVSRIEAVPTILEVVCHATGMRFAAVARATEISVPIILADNSFFGTLCAIDPRPARLNTPETVGMFRLFAELIAKHLDADRKLVVTESALVESARSRNCANSSSGCSDTICALRYTSSAAFGPVGEDSAE